MSWGVWACVWLLLLSGCGPCGYPGPPIPPSRPVPAASVPAEQDPSPSVSIAPQEASVESNRLEIEAVLQVLRARLLLMPEVAKVKWNKQLPISDPPREEQLLAKVEELARKSQLSATAVRAVFEAQITAGKQIQQDLHEQWKAEQHGQFPDALDLQNDLRPQIDELNRELVEKLAGISAADHVTLYERGAKILAGDPVLTDAVRAQSLAPWKTP